MCGIIGVMGTENVADRLIEGLRRLEYRGYDSAGVCTLVGDGPGARLERRRAQGKLDNLVKVLAADPITGLLGIAHTRWATHGAPTVDNAHPHATSEVALVHNGIIENFKALRDELIADGRSFESQTDTEVVAQLISREVERGVEPRDAVAGVLKRLHGAFAFAIIFRRYPDLMIGARRGSPLVLGYGNGEMFLGSDELGLAPLTNRIAYLEEGDWVVISRQGAQVYDAGDQPVTRPVITSTASGAMIGKGNHRHYMEKEIYEQPTVVSQTLGQYLRPLEQVIDLPDLPFDLTAVRRIIIVACGTSFYAGQVAKYWIEACGRVPVELDNASEFRYRDPVFEDGGLAIFISQSGETADTLAALRHAKAAGQYTMTIVNVPTSTMAREADVVLPTYAGPEIGVASTKAFTCQLAVLAAFAVALGTAKGRIDAAEEHRLAQLLTEVPAAMNAALAQEPAIAALSQRLARAQDILYMGRGQDFPIALEGALKLKEISYIHAEGYAAGELKHGPIALIDENVPVIVIAPTGQRFDKTMSNMQEVIARGGQIVLVSDAAGIEAHGDGTMATLAMPMVDSFIAPLIYAVPIQLIAYHVAIAKGTDVDQPRNLAKSVTVE